MGVFGVNTTTYGGSGGQNAPSGPEAGPSVSAVHTWATDEPLTELAAAVDELVEVVGTRAALRRQLADAERRIAELRRAVADIAAGTT